MIVASSLLSTLVRFQNCIFLIKIQIENYLKPPFLIVSAGKWVRVDNIRFARQHKVFCDFFGHSQGALEHFGSFLQVELFWGENGPYRAQLMP